MYSSVPIRHTINSSILNDVIQPTSDGGYIGKTISALLKVCQLVNNNNIYWQTVFLNDLTFVFQLIGGFVILIILFYYQAIEGRLSNDQYRILTALEMAPVFYMLKLSTAFFICTSCLTLSTILSFMKIDPIQPLFVSFSKNFACFSHIQTYVCHHIHWNRDFF